MTSTSPLPPPFQLLLHLSLPLSSLSWVLLGIGRVIVIVVFNMLSDPWVTLFPLWCVEEHKTSHIFFFFFPRYLGVAGLHFLSIFFALMITCLVSCLLSVVQCFLSPLIQSVLSKTHFILQVLYAFFCLFYLLMALIKENEIQKTKWKQRNNPLLFFFLPLRRKGTEVFFLYLFM